MKRIDYKWTALALLWVACFLQQGMRQIFPPLASTIGDSFGASATFRGSVMSVFTLVYALAVPFSGIAGDFLSRKKIVAFSLFVFSMGVFGAGWAASILGIMLLYGAVNGFGQSFFYPAATSLVQQLHSDNKATALSILQLALYSGIILFSFASGKMLDVCGSWHVPFRAFGFAGIIWAIALLFLLRDTKPVATIGGEKPKFSEALKAVFSKPSALLLAAGLGLQIFVDVGFKMWMPTYLQETFSAQMPQMGKADWGLHAVLWHYLGAFVGVMIGSRISDRLVRGRPGIRMEMNIIGLLLGAPFIWWMAKADTFVAICVAMGLFGLFRGVYDSNQFASIFDVVAPRYRASAMGIILCFAFVFGAIAPMVLGWMKDNFSMSAGLAGLSVFFVVAAFVILLARLVFLKRDYVKPMLALAAALSCALVANACMTFVVGKKVSSTGYVIVGHNEDDPSPCWVHHGMLPARNTLACYWSEVKFPYGDGNADSFLNEKGVFIVSNSGGNSTERMDDPTLLTEGGVKFELRRAVGERATSARDAVRIIGELVERYGYAPSARIYTVADRDEAWLVQVVHGHNYVAVRCPDDEVTIMPNLYTVYELDSHPTGSVIASSNLIVNAKAKGFWNGVGKFNFAKAYQGSYDFGPNHTFAHPNNTCRFHQAIRLITGADWPKDQLFPFSVKPRTARFSPDDVKSLLSAHNAPLKDGRHVLESWSICAPSTVESSICVFAADPVHTEMRVALGRGCETPYRSFMPFVVGVPSDFDESSTAVERLADHVKPAMQLSPLFAAHMVVAADKPIRVFGTGEGKATVTFLGHTASTVSHDGKWCVELPACRRGGPYELEVNLGYREIVIDDVMVGDVIMLAGQSNLQFKLAASKTDKATWFDDWRIRFFSTQRLEAGEPFAPRHGWLRLQRGNAGRWSAVGYETAVRITARTGGAVGVINCYQGASTIQAWMDASLAAEKRFALPDGGKLHGDATLPAFFWNKPGTLYRSQFASIVPYALSWVVWYQGESNTGHLECSTYADLLAALIGEWRADLRDAELPFCVVQLANFTHRNDDDWRLVQSAQAKVPSMCRNVYLVRSADVCEDNDIHPPTKCKLASRIVETMMND